MQLFQNLISNSIKYRGRGNTEDPCLGGERRGRMAACGAGQRPQDVGRVFGMFKRLHGSEIPGTGIGLALCKKIVERQGGRIWVESEAGRGATFQFTIPNGHKEPGPRRVD